MNRTRRLLVAAAIAVGTVVLPLAAGPVAPASAGSGYPFSIASVPGTWVDGQGRQLMVLSTTSGVLQVVRDTPTGEPDLTWGQNGARNVPYAAPDGVLTTSPLFAIDDAGIVTLVHTTSACDDTTCDLLFQRVDGTTGATVGTAVAVEGALAPWRPLDDGSLLVRTAGNQLDWRGPDGSDRGALGRTTDEVVDADVDAAGRLLVIGDDGAVTRQAAGAASDLTVATGCDQSAHDAIVGASPAAAGFAVACDPGAGDGVRVTRYTEAGTVQWTAASTAAKAPTGFATEVTVTAADAVWVGVRNPTTDPAEPTVGLISANPATSAGWGDQVDLRVTGQPSYFVLGPIADRGGGVVQLRPIGTSAEVAVADLRVCCQYPNRTSENYRSQSSIVPYRSGPPDCSPAPVSLSSRSAGALEVSFTPCGSDLQPGRKPTSYRIDLLVDGVTTTKTVTDLGVPFWPRVTFTGIGNGKLVRATVTASNGEGESLAGSIWEGTVFPFSNGADFAQYQSEHLAWRTIPISQLANYYYGIPSGNPTAGAVMDQFLTDGTARKSVEPVSRIYRAAFLRDADTSGLRYWVPRHRTGTRIAAIAEQFARSSEFQRRYGTLTNRQYVERIYQNVLGRPGDPAGIAFWTARLDAGAATRGKVLADFSESGEFIRKTLGRAQVTTVTYLMLDRAPTAAEQSTWSGNADVYGALPVTILATETYAARTRQR